MILGVDHVLIAVENLDKARDLYLRLGFEVQYGGQHVLAGTHNAVIPLSDGSYLELVGVTDPSLAQRFPFSRQVMDALDRTNRFATFALETNDYSNDVQAIRDRGLAIAKAAPGERLRPDGERVSWWTAHPEDPRLPFLIQDLTPRVLRVPALSEGIGRSTRMGRVEVGTATLQPMMTAYTQLLGERPVEDQFSLQRGVVKLSQSFSGDGIQMVVLLTQDTARIAGEWKARGIPFFDEDIRGMGRVLVPRDTEGARISFCQAQRGGPDRKSDG
jgi:catechol 2,3-dioxygenase-like lactoylglutathione lyase family enzyme